MCCLHTGVGLKLKKQIVTCVWASENSVTKAAGDRKPVISYLVLIFNRGNARAYKNPAEYKETNSK